MACHLWQSGDIYLGPRLGLSERGLKERVAGTWRGEGVSARFPCPWQLPVAPKESRGRLRSTGEVKLQASSCQSQEEALGPIKPEGSLGG